MQPQLNLTITTCRKLATTARFSALVAGFWLATASLAWSANAPDPLIEPGPAALTNTLAQIAALQAEASALSPTQKKIATPLRDALREFRGAAPRAYAPRVHSNLKLRSGGMVLVDIRATVSTNVLAYLQAQGAKVVSSFPQYHTIRADIPIGAIESIAAHGDIKFVRPAEIPVANAGTATSEGYYAEAVDRAELNFNVNGSGVKVGVISSSVLYLTNSQANGDLPYVNVLPGQNGIGLGGTDEGEGTAMLEIVYDLVPGASLYFATGFAGDSSMASNIIALADAGCRVIIDDVTYGIDSPFHGNQPITQAIKTVSDRGVMYFSSAANSGSFNKGTSGTWTGNFVSRGYDPRYGGQVHDWGGTAYNQITRQGGPVTLFWSDPWGNATNDYDLFITDVNGNVLRSDMQQFTGYDTNDLTGRPYETVAASTNSGEYVVVALASGAQRDIWVGTGRGQLAHATDGNARGHNAAPVDNAFSVAAASAHGLGPGMTFVATNQVESFSSDGLPRLFYETDGTPVTPNNLTASGGRGLVKPDFTAADGVIASTNTFGTNTLFTPFYGTSAAAPHAGAIAALIMSYRPDLTPAQIRQAMMSAATVLDIELPGFDENSGAGIVMANAAMISVDNTPPVVAVTSPPNNGAVNLLASIGGTASDIGSGLQGNQIHFTLNNNGNFWSGTYWTNTVSTDPSILLAATVANGHWTFTNVPTGGNQVQGTYYVSAFAQDNAGNVSQAQAGVTSTSFTISTTPPTVAITFPANGSTITNQLGGNWFQGTASGNLGISVSMSLFIRRNSDNLYWSGSGWGNVTNGFISNTYNSGTHTWQSTGPLPVPGSSLGNGDYHFIAIAVDAAGNQQQVDSVVSVDFHPVYTFTAGSYFDTDPNNDNMRWDNPANWDVGSVPTPDARVVINNYTPDNTALGNVNLYRLDLSGGTLTTVGMTLQKLYLSGGALSGGTITMTTNGVFNWSGGIISGVVTVPASATLNLSGGTDKTISAGSTFYLAGNTTWTGSGSLSAGYGVDIENSGTFSIQDVVQFFNYTGGAPNPLFNNTGILQKTNSNGVATISSANGGWNLSNSGTLDIENGVLSSQAYLYLNNGTRFSGSGELRVDGGSALLTGTNTLHAGASFEMAAGTLSGTNFFAGPGTFVWSGGTLQGANTILSNANFSITGSAPATLTGAVTNYGNCVWTGTGVINVQYGSVFENDGSFSAQSDAEFFNFTGGTPLPLFVNNGSFTKTNSTGTTDFDPANGGVAFNNQGTLNSQSGSITLGGGGVSQNAVFNAAPGSEVDLTGGTHNFGAGLTFASGLTRLTAGSLNFAGTNALANGAAFEVAGGNVTGTNTFGGTGAFNWSGGTISALINLQSNVTFNIRGAGDKTLFGGGINSSGGGSWTDGGNVNVSYGSVVNNSGNFLVQNDAEFFNYTGGAPGPVFINSGSFTKTNSTGTTDFNSANGGVAFNNLGAVNVRSGNLTLGGGGTAANESFTAAAGSVVDFYAGAFFFNGNLALLGSGTNRVNGAAVTFNNGTNSLGGANTFEIAAGSVSGTNTFSGVGTVNWSGGFIAATLNLQPNIAFDLSTANTKTLAPSGNLIIGGNSLWSGGDVYAAYAASVINNGSFSVQSGAQFFNYTGGTPGPVFVNNGSFIKSTVAATTTFSPANGGVAFNHNGNINVQAGDLVLAGGGSGVNGVCIAAAGSHIDLTGGNFDWSGNTAISGAGVTRVNGGALSFGGGTDLTGSFEVAAGSAGGTNTFSGNGAFNWTGGGITGNFTLQSNLALNISGNADKTLANGTLATAGTSTWSGAGSLDMSYNSTINNNGILVVQNDAQFFNYTGGAPTPAFNNSGTFRKIGGTNATVFASANGGVNFSNTGTVDLRSGTLEIYAGYATSPASQLKISLGGPGAGTQFGTEAFNGAATFDGTLGITLTNGFAPTNGNSFVLATYPSSSGQFSATALPSLPVISKWQLTYTPTALLLQVIPANAFQSAALTNGDFAFMFGGQTGSRCLIEVSTNLTAWSPLLTNTPFSGLLYYVDPHTPQFTKRFYRATIYP